MEEKISPEAINHLLIQVSRQHFTRLHALMETAGLHRGQPPLLHLLWKQEGCTQSDLAAGLRSQPATVTKMLQRMELAGFIERRPDAEDQRVSRVISPRPVTHQRRRLRAGAPGRAGDPLRLHPRGTDTARAVFESNARQPAQVNGGLPECDFCSHHGHTRHAGSCDFDDPQQGEPHP